MHRVVPDRQNPVQFFDNNLMIAILFLRTHSNY